MVALGKMNKAQLIARVQELEKQSEGFELWKETAIKDVLDTREELSEVIANLKEKISDYEGCIPEWVGKAGPEDIEETVSTLSEKTNELEEEVKKLEKENDKYVSDLTKFASGEWENKDRHFERENLNKQNEKLKEEVEKLKEEKQKEKEKVAVFHEWLIGDQGHFKDWLREEGGPTAPDGFYWDYVSDPINPDIQRLTLVKKKTAIDYWKSCDGDEEDAPEALLNAIAEKCGLKPLDFDDRADGITMAELWDKICDELEER